MNKIMQTIENEAADELEEVLQDMPAGCSIWNNDHKRNPKVDFYKDQKQNCKLI